MFGKLTVFASRNKAEIQEVLPKDRAAEIGDYVRHRIAEGPKAAESPAASPPTADGDDPYRFPAV